MIMVMIFIMMIISIKWIRDFSPVFICFSWLFVVFWGVMKEVGGRNVGHVPGGHVVQRCTRGAVEMDATFRQT